MHNKIQFEYEVNKYPMTKLKTLIKENASLIGELKYNVKEKQRYIRVLEEEIYQLKGLIRDRKQVLAKLEGKE